MIVHVVPVSTNDKAHPLSEVQTSTVTGEESTDGPASDSDAVIEETDFDAPNMQEVRIFMHQLLFVQICKCLIQWNPSNPTP